MFDVDSAIAQWRSTQNHTGVQGDDLDELESHLRDTVAALGKTSLSNEEAFLVAVHRLGPSQEIAREFAKVDRAAVWMNRLVWMLAGYLVANLGALALGVLTRAGHLLATRYHLSPSVAVSLACYAPLVVVTLAGLALYATPLRRSALALDLVSRTFSTPSLAAVSCALILSAYVVDFLVRRLSFAIPIQESQRLGQKLAVRDGLIMILCPVAAAVVAIYLARYKQRRKQPREFA